MQILENHSWDGWIAGPDYLFNEHLGLRFTLEELKLYWLTVQRLKIYEEDRKRSKQLKFDFADEYNFPDIYKSIGIV